MTSLHTLIQTLDNWMEADSFKDYAPNGLQVEGLGSVYKLALGVTASADVIEQAAVWGADALLVHHGYFWKNESPTLIGMKGHRVRALFENQISLIAYHLPLDCHPEFGNNKTLLDQLDLSGGTAIEGERGLLWSVPPKWSIHAASTGSRSGVSTEPDTAGNRVSPCAEISQSIDCLHRRGPGLSVKSEVVWGRCLFVGRNL